MIEYKTCLLAHIDVMGFKNLLKDNSGSRDKLSRYFQTAKKFVQKKNNIYNNSASEDNFKAMFVSDSIILSVEIDKMDAGRYLVAARFFATIAALQSDLAIKEKIWTRGAVSIGPLCMNVDENILVGQSFVDAYNLEQKANYPRVIIDPKTISYFEDTAGEFIRQVEASYEGLSLIGVYNSNRLGDIHFKNEAVMIDWFKYAIRNDENLEPFLKDLKERMGADFELFQKGNALLSYLWESYCRIRFPEDGTISNSISEEIGKMIESLK